MQTIYDFTAMDDSGIALFVQNHLKDFGEPNSEGKQGEILKNIEHGYVVERLPHGFAIINPGLDDDGDATLVYLYAAIPRQGVGKTLIERVRQRYGKTKRIILLCYGEERLKYFTKNGFEVLKNDGDEVYAMGYPPSVPFQP
ncbi:hypothetical protein RugamoR64_24410 [Duganella rhizosphaerae]|uniref:hypothetical protein n=1 Tax=Duganella rhizosphaerae TaxID=2885763 RepID=UPI0030E7C995